MGMVRTAAVLAAQDFNVAECPEVISMFDEDASLPDDDKDDEREFQLAR
jgi:hypothetical protein